MINQSCLKYQSYFQPIQTPLQTFGQQNQMIKQYPQQISICQQQYVDNKNFQQKQLVTPQTQSMRNFNQVQVKKDMTFSFNGHQKQQEGFFCVNHNNQKAIYYLDINKNFYCEICNTQLQQLNIQTQKINNKEIKNENSELNIKEGQIQNFLKQLKEISKRFIVTQQQIQKSKEEFQKLYFEQEQQIDKIQNQIEQCIQEKISQVRQDLNNQKRINLKQLETYSQYLQQFDSQFKAINDDIDQNYSIILDSMEIRPFLQIIDLYNCKIKEGQDFLSYLVNEKTNIQMIKSDFKQIDQICFNFLDIIVNQQQKQHQYFGENSKTLIENIQMNQQFQNQNRCDINQSNQQMLKILQNAHNTNIQQYFFLDDGNLTQQKNN